MGENMRTVCTMEDAEEIDILGDFDYKSSVVLREEDPELPSNSVQLLPEFSQHPWLLDQGWSLDHCTDERSRAVIEKMLLEEQSYADGRVNKSEPTKFVKSYIKSLDIKGDKKVISHRKSCWSVEERTLFYQGYKFYGRRWSKIAELIPSKTHKQVKNYGLHFFKRKEPSLLDRLGLVSESHTTSQALTSKTNYSQRDALVKSGTSACASGLEQSEVVRIKKSDSDSESDIDVEVNSDDENVSQCLETSDRKLPDISRNSIDSSKQLSATCIVKQEIISDGDSYDSGPARACGTSYPEQGGSNATCKSDDHQPAGRLHPSNDCGDTNRDLSAILKIGKCFSLCKKGDSASSSSITGDSGNVTLETDHLEHEQNDNRLTAELLDSNISTGEGEHMNDEEDTEQHSGEYAILSSDGQLVYLPNPECEVVISPEDISDQEREIHAEFFCGKNNTKTPERYMKIRNHIIDCWKKTQPAYLKKTAVRSGLRNCGDVNCMGRIHSYLEQIGAINFGCEQAQYNHPNRLMQLKPARGPNSKEMREKMKLIRLESMRPRRRRVRDSFGEWTDGRHVEGKTIEHRENKKSDVKSGPGKKYNPFVLIPCKKHNQNHPAPYIVSITTTALVVMDIHAHLVKTEVIGLLGGHYNKERCELAIMTAEPCDSLSTSMQCEMDPVSQTHASERLQLKGQSVVGWYHSHPLFDAQPSVRDMETQADFQNWFANEGNAFVGIIISPYNQNCFSLFSDVRCLAIEKENNQTDKPYEFEYQVLQSHVDVDGILLTVQKLADLYADYINKVQLSDQFRSYGSLTYLDKLLHSIKRYFIIGNSNNDDKKSMQKLEECIQQILH